MYEQMKNKKILLFIHFHFYIGFCKGKNNADKYFLLETQKLNQIIQSLYLHSTKNNENHQKYLSIPKF